MLLPSALGFSPHPPVSVYGTGFSKAIVAFLDSWLVCFATFIRSLTTLHVSPRGFAYVTVTCLRPVSPLPAHTLPLCPHSSVY